MIVMASQRQPAATHSVLKLALSIKNANSQPVYSSVIVLAELVKENVLQHAQTMQTVPTVSKERHVSTAPVARPHNATLACRKPIARRAGTKQIVLTAPVRIPQANVRLRVHRMQIVWPAQEVEVSV